MAWWRLESKTGQHSAPIPLEIKQILCPAPKYKPWHKTSIKAAKRQNPKLWNAPANARIKEEEEHQAKAKESPSREERWPSWHHEHHQTKRARWCNVNAWYQGCGTGRRRAGEWCHARVEDKEFVTQSREGKDSDARSSRHNQHNKNPHSIPTKF